MLKLLKFRFVVFFFAILKGFRVKFFSFSIFKNNMEKIKELKDVGNSYYKKNDFQKALDCYTNGVNLLSERQGDEALLCNLLSNRAVCFLKLGKYEPCVEDCSSVLAFSFNSHTLKALYRRASAHRQLGHLIDARGDLQHLLKIEPDNNEAKTLLKEIAFLIQKASPSSEVQRVLDDISKDKKNLLNGIKCLIDLCHDDAQQAFQFGRNLGLKLVSGCLAEEEQTSEVFTSALRLFSVVTNHRSFCTKFISINAEDENEEESPENSRIHLEVSTSGIVSLHSVFSCFEVSQPDLQKTVIMICMNIFRSLPVVKVDEHLVDQNSTQLYLPPVYGKLFISSLLQLLQNFDQVSFVFANEAFGAFISDQPNYYDSSKIVDTRMESLEERKLRIEQSSQLGERARAHSQWAIECGAVKLLSSMLDHDLPVVRQSISSTLGKLIKFLNNDDKIKNELMDCLGGNEDDFFVFYRKRAALEACLLLTHPELGTWMLQQQDGIVELVDLIRTQDVRNCEFASEVICLASGIDAALILLKPIVEAGLIESLMQMNHDGIRSNATSAMTKLSIQSKALTVDSPENSQILNTVASILKSSSNSKDQSLVPAQVTTSAERCIEILAALSGRSYMKEEIVHGSGRVKSCISELTQIPLASGSPAVFGLAYVLASLTVTNRELRAIALADKEMTLEQYDKLKELQRIKAQGENGEVIEEKKVRCFLPYVISFNCLWFRRKRITIPKSCAIEEY
jgi:hypothetical protein